MFYKYDNKKKPKINELLKFDSTFILYPQKNSVKINFSCFLEKNHHILYIDVLYIDV